MAALVLTAALGFRLAVVAATSYSPHSDAADYDRLAVSLAVERRFPQSLITVGPTALRPPLFPLVLAAAYRMSGDADGARRIQAGRMALALVGTAIVGLIGWIAARMWGGRVTLVAMAIAAVYPPFLLWGTALFSDSLFVATSLAAVALVLWARAGPGRLGWVALAGCAAGAAMLVRSVGVFAIPALGLAVWTARPRFSLRALAAPVVFTGALAATLAPWTIRNAHAFHAFVPVSTQTGVAVAGVFNDQARAWPVCRGCWLLTPPNPQPPLFPDRDEVALDRRLRSETVTYAGHHPTYVGTVVGWNLIRLAGLQGPRYEREVVLGEIVGVEAPGGVLSVLGWLAPLGFSAIAILASLSLVTGRARRLPAWIWLVSLAPVLAVIPVFVLPRYRMPMEAALILVAAARLAPARWAR